VKTFRLLASFVIFGGVAAGCLAQIAQKKGGFIFRVHYTPGQVLKLDSTMTFINRGSDPAGTVKASTTLKVLTVSKGIANVEMLVTPGVLAGTKTQVTPAQKMVLRLDDKNRSADKKELGGGMIALPARPMNPGSTWKTYLPLKDPSGVIQTLTAIYRFSGISNENGHQVAVVTYILSGFANGTGAMKLLVKDGSLYSNITNLSLTSGSTVSKVQTVVKRIQ